MADPETILHLRLVKAQTLREIGLAVGLSRERVRQILLAHNVRGGRVRTSVHHERNVNRNPDHHPLKEAKVQAVYGCSVNELADIQLGRPLSDPLSPAHVYRSQRKHFEKKGMWAFNFVDWWDLWQVRWPSRMTDHLVMVPRDPSKPFGFANAEIISRGQNMARHWKRKRTA